VNAAAVRACAAAAALAAVAFAPGRAEAIFASPIQAGCFATRGGCRIHVDPFTIMVAPGRQLESFEIRVGGVAVYEFRTDVSNPPVGPYAPTLPEPGFAARCERSYVVNLLGRDSGDAETLNLGQTTAVDCPVQVPEPDPGLAAIVAAAGIAAVRARRSRAGKDRGLGEPTA
jgi:hypothetical protein